MKYRLFSALLVLAMLVAACPPVAAETVPSETPDVCYYSFEVSPIYLPIILEGDSMTQSAISARLARAKEGLSRALGGRFQETISYRQGQIDYAEYDDDGRLVRATMTVDGVANVPVHASAGDALNVGDSIQVVNRGSPANPLYKYDMHTMSSFAEGGTSPAATLPTPISVTVTSTLRHPTTGGQIAAIHVTWRALKQSVMGDGGYYEVELKRQDEDENHVSNCPHRLGETALDGSATYNDTTVDVDDTTDFPASGRVRFSDAEISYTGKTSTSFTGVTWVSGSGTYADDTQVTGLTLLYTFDHVATGTQYLIRVRAVSVTGAVSEWASWSSITTGGNKQLQIEDKFDGYGGEEVSPLESLFFLIVQQFEDASGWNTMVAGGVGTATPYDDNTNGRFVEGKQGIKLDIVYTGGPLSTEWQSGLDVSLDLSNDNRFTNDDYVAVSVYLPSLTNIVAAGVSFVSPVGNSVEFKTSVGSLSAGMNHLKWERSDGVESGTIDWSNITEINIIIEATDTTEGTFDDWRIVKADEADADTYNDTGNIWDFDPQQGDGSEWHIYPGNRSGEPAKPFSLGQIQTAASPADWYLAYHALSDIYYGTSVVGAYLKADDGEIALAFCIRDPADATRTLYAVEADSDNDKVRLVRWVSGARTQIAEVDFTFASDEIIWLGADWRDFDEEGRIKVYASLTEGNVIQAANLVISETDTNIERGGYVGVMTKEASARFVDFRAGSPQHAMTAEVAFFAHRAKITSESIGAALGAFLALPGLRGFWPMSSFDDSGNALDVSGNGRTLTYNGNPVYNCDGLIPYIDLDGTGDYLSRADEAGLDILGSESYIAAAMRGLTMGGWFRFDTDSPSAHEALLTKGDGTAATSAYWMSRLTSNVLYGRVSNGTAWTTLSGASIGASVWAFCILRYDPGSELALYQNGLWTKTATSIPASLPNVAAPFNIGTYNNTGSQPLNGQASLCFLCAARLDDIIIHSLFEQTRELFGV